MDDLTPGGPHSLANLRKDIRLFRGKTLNRHSWFAAGVLAAVTLVAAGCSRSIYRTRADQDVRAILEQKRCEEAYTLPPLPGIQVDSRSRFYDPSPPDCPTLPYAVPTLYGYELPELVTGDPSQSRDTSESEEDDTFGSEEPDDRSVEEPEQPANQETLQIPAPELTAPELKAPEVDSLPLPAPELETVSYEDQLPTNWTEPKPTPESNTPSTLLAFPPAMAGASRQVLLAEMIQDYAEQSPGPTPDSLAEERKSQQSLEDPPNEDTNSEQTLRIVPIPDSFWGQLPDTCLPRMLEFESVRKEFRRSFSGAEDATLESLLSDSPRLTLPMIMELVSINSRELQTQKERLYLAALALSEERYEYLLRPTRRGNGVAADYSYERVNGSSQSGLGIGSGVAVQKTTAMAGQFLTSFANDVVLTFNGPQGFFADISSALVFDFQQTIFQRDRVFEGLTQAERDVIYAARDYIQFRRDLFVDFAARYYNLLLTYRGIEISAQDYFSNTRAFLQGRAEYFQAGRIPRVQVDQFEQNALRSRSSLVRNCNSLETSLDRLKLEIGLPPEMPLNLNLDELEALTASDELTVTQQLVVRTRQSLVDATEQRPDDRDASVINATVLVNRLIDTLRVRRRLEGASEDSEAARKAKIVGKRLALLDARLRADQSRRILDLEFLGEQEPQALKQFRRTTELIAARLDEMNRAIELRELLDQPDLAPAKQQTRVLETDLGKLLDECQLAIEARKLNDLGGFVVRANDLLRRTKRLESQVVGELLPEDENEIELLLRNVVDESLALVDAVLTNSASGLDEVEVDEEESLMLALYQRLDLANTRGELADQRRRVKLAADDLRAILDLRATHSLRARRLVSDNFDVRSDGATTRLSFALDTPLNRRIERNNYRASLINYDRARRALIDNEDTIKFSIRENLRQLRLQRDQYEISVAQAALAFERVVSTRLQLKLAVGNVV
ncbi:MAG: TolC family protein, partial [Planctomycetota bacterium]